MKIALLTTYPHGGAGIACKRLQAALQSSGVYADLLTINDLSWNWPFYAERLSFLPFERDKSVRFAFSLANFGHDLSRHPIVRKADVLHLHWINQGLLSLKNIQKLIRLSKPVVWTLHDMWAFTGGCHYSRGCLRYLNQCGNCPMLSKPAPDDLSNRIWRQKKRYFTENLNFITCSTWLADIAKKSELLENFPITVLPNTLDTTVFAPRKPTQVAAFRTQQGTQPNATVLLFAAVKVRDERKGFHFLKQALEIVRRENPEREIMLMVIGHTEPGDLEGLPYPIQSLGVIRDPEKLALAYASADVFIIPSLEDNLPNTVLEALSCGTPVIGFNTGGIPEMVEHQQNGYIATAQTGQALADGIRWFLNHKDFSIDRLKRAARQTIELRFAPEIVANQHIALYQSLLQPKN